MRFRSIAACALLATLPAVAASQALQFKGLAMGASKEELMQRFPGLTCSKVPPQFAVIGEETCRADRACSDAACHESKKAFDTYGGAPAWDIAFSLAQSKVVGFSATIHPGSYESVREALKEIYGPGREEVNVMVRSNGTKFDSRQWNSAAQAPNIVVLEHAGRVNEARVQATTEALVEWRQAAKRGDPKKNKGDL
jgi:hypothetical protein